VGNCSVFLTNCCVQQLISNIKLLAASICCGLFVIIFRTNSVRELGLFAENANAMNRLIQHQISFTEARSFVFDTPDGINAEDVCFPSIAIEDDDDDAAFLERAVFQLGASDDETEDATLGVWSEDELELWSHMDSFKQMQLPGASKLESWSRVDGCKPIQLPGASKLALRRQAMRHRCSIDSDDAVSLSSCSPPADGCSPTS